MEKAEKFIKNKLEKNDVIEITVDNLGINGEGVARYNGMAVFIKGALPGERIRAKIILVKPKFLIAIIEEILLSSVNRVKAPCEIFGKCGGCSVQHLRYSEQLKFKQNKVKETLLKVGGIDAKVDECVKSESEYYYRNKLSLPVRQVKRSDGSSVSEVGFFSAASHRIVPIKTCKIQFKESDALIKMFKEFMAENALKGYDESDGSGDIRHLVARKIGGVIFITIVTPRGDLPQIKAFSAVCENHFKNSYALYLNINTKNDNVILGDKTKFISGFSGSLNIDGINLTVHPASFFQVNDGIRKEIYNRVSEGLSGTVLECYSGAGLLSAKISKSCDLVVAVEVDKKATDACLETLRLNKISNVRVVNGDCAKEVPLLAAGLKGRGITVILDPPRSGCDRAVLSAVIETKAQKIIYVSCSPSTLARDVKILVEGGYNITKVTPLDMFPNTMEVETICILQKKED